MRYVSLTIHVHSYLQLFAGTAAEEQSTNKQIVNAVMPVSVTFMVVCCVAVAGGFVGGFFKSPRGKCSVDTCKVKPGLTLTHFRFDREEEALQRLLTEE